MRSTLRKFQSVLPLAIALGTAPAAMAAGSPLLVPSPVQKVFVPEGFDDNDNVQVVLHGHFPNACYKTGPVEAKVDQDAKTITIDPQAYYYQGFCAMVVIPFIKQVNLGVVKAGTYTLRLKDRQDIAPTTLTISPAKTTAPDDFLYAPVETSDLVKDEQGRSVLRVEGTWPYTLTGCMTMKEVKAKQTAGQVLVVQPIADMVESGPACDEQRHSHRFRIDTPVNTNSFTTEKDLLLHVRVLNGNSFNRLVNLGEQDDHL